MGDTARKFARELNEESQAGNANPYRGTGYQVVGLLSESPNGCSEDLGELGILGDARQLMSLVRAHDVDEIVVALDEQQAAAAVQYTSTCLIVANWAGGSAHWRRSTSA